MRGGVHLVGAFLTLYFLGIAHVEAQSDQQNVPPRSKGQTESQAGQKGGVKGAGRKKVGVNFDEIYIGGELKRPELMSILQKKQYNFGRLIKLRENFLPEMRKTTEAIQRRGGSGE